jgi:hypothetical protein
MKKTLLSLLVALSFLQSAKAQGDPPQDTCLIAKYYFNYGNVNDDHIYGYNGKQVGATLGTDRFGNPNAAWYLNGTPNSYLNLGTYPALKPQTLSVSMWFKITAPCYAGSGYAYNPLLLTKCQAGNNCYEAYSLYYSYNTFGIGGANTQLFCNQPCVWTSPVASGGWHHVVMTYDNAVITMYLDAVSQGTVSKGFSSVYLASDSVMVGNSANVMNSRYLNGAVDDMRFYHCILDQTEVTSLFNEPNPFSTTGINTNNTLMKTEIFPNPTTGEFTITVSKLNEISTIEVYNTLGQIVKQEQLTNLQTKINLNEQAKGVYMVRITENSKPVYFSKIVKQ